MSLAAHLANLNAKTLAWIAEDPDNRWAGLYVEDLSHWAEMGVHTVAQFQRYEMETSIWDLYKDVNGFRPRHIDFKAMSDEELKREYDSLCKRLGEQIDEENTAKDKAWADFQTQVAKNLSLGAHDEQEAIRWVVESLNPSQSDLWYGGEWVCFELGLSFDRGYVFNKACKELAEKFEKEAA